MSSQRNSSREQRPPALVLSAYIHIYIGRRLLVFDSEFMFENLGRPWILALSTRDESIKPSYPAFLNDVWCIAMGSST